MENFSFIFLGGGSLVLVFLYISLLRKNTAGRKHHKKVAKKARYPFSSFSAHTAPPADSTPAAPPASTGFPLPAETPAYNLFSEKFKQLDARLDSLAGLSDINSIHHEITLLKKCLADIEEDTVEKIDARDAEKETLKLFVSGINRKIEEILQRLIDDDARLVHEKEVLEMKISQAEDREKQGAAAYAAEMDRFRQEILALAAPYKGIVVETLSGEIIKFKDEIYALASQYKINAEGIEEQLNAKQEEINRIGGVPDMPGDKRFLKIEEIRKNNDSLKEMIIGLRESYDQAVKRNFAVKSQLEMEFSQLKHSISATEKENQQIEKLLSEKKSLETQAALLREQMEQQEQAYNNALAGKTEQIKMLSLEAEEKEKKIQETCVQEEEKLSAEKSELEAEIERLKQQLAKLKDSSAEVAASLRDELEQFQSELRLKTGKYAKLRKDRVSLEKEVQEKLQKQIDELDREIEEKTRDYKNELKVRDEQVYLLKTRLSIREDKLKNDLERRSKAQEKLLEEMKATAESLRKTLEGNKSAAAQQIEILSKKVEALKQEVVTVGARVNDEEVIAGKMESERKKIEKEIHVIGGKLEKDLLDMQEFIIVKNKQVKALSDEIIEKERLLKVEHEALGKIVDLSYKFKPHQSHAAPADTRQKRG